MVQLPATYYVRKLIVPYHISIIIFLVAWLCLAARFAPPLVDAASLDKSQVSTSSSPNNSGPRIYITPEKPSFLIDTPTPGTRVLSCKTSGDKPDMFSQLRWTGPNRLDNWDELSKRHSVSEDGKDSNVWDLEFINPTVDDSGIYYCLGTYQSSDSFNASIYVEVHNPIRLENCYEKQFVIEGSTNGRVSCRITADSSTVSILKDGLPISALANRYMWDNEDGLVINGAVNQSDAGRFTIKVKAPNIGLKRQQVIDLEVHSKPEVTPYNGSQPGNEFFGVEGQQAQLYCRAYGRPQPLIQWRDPRLRNLTSVGGYHVNQETGVLTITRVKKYDDHGTFQCIATNTVDQAVANVSLFVDVQPEIVMFDNKTVDEGSEVTFECRSSGDPEPKFSIRKYGFDQLPYNPGHRAFRDALTQPEGPGSNVYVHRVTILADRSLSGLHYCNATNRAGTAERVNQLRVNYLPDLSSTPPEQPVRFGKKFALTCHIRAYPEPSVTWWTDNTQIINPHVNIKTSLDGQTHVVTMMPPDSEQITFNKYTCRASNKMGMAEQVITPRHITAPGVVTYEVKERLPTAVRLLLAVPQNGGDRIRGFKYRAEGRTLDFNHPVYSYRVDIHNETYIEASPKPAEYMIRNLLPYYRYKVTIRAQNEVGDGDPSELTVDTAKPKRPEPPVILEPASALATHSISGILSDYQDGYLLRWSPPDSDNGDPVTKYIISYSQLGTGSCTKQNDDQVQVVEQMNERPLHARLGPLEPNQKYLICLRARNDYGDSEASSLVILTSTDRPSMPEFSTSIITTVLIAAVLLTIVIDLVFCFCFQMGLCHVVHKKGVITLLC